VGAIAATAVVSALIGALVAGGGAATAGPAADLPKNTTKPAISGAARDGETLRVSPGTWSGTQPMTFSYQWYRCTAQLSNCAQIAGATQNEFKLTTTDVGKRLIVTVLAKNSAGGGNAPISYGYQWQRCDSAGNACANVAGANATTFPLGSADVQHRLRVAVTARNSAGSSTATSGPTALVTQAPPPGPGGQIKLPNGMTSIPATSVAAPERLIVDRVSFSPSTVRSRTPFSVTMRVVDTRGYAVRDALVFIRSTPLVTSTPAEQRTGQDGTVTMQLTPESSFPLRNGWNVQFFVRARKDGENVLAGVSTRRLVQVRTATQAR
jgi:hypothetical protein